MTDAFLLMPDDEPASIIIQLDDFPIPESDYPSVKFRDGHE